MHTTLKRYGYTRHFTKYLAESGENLTPGRIVFLSRGRGRVMTEDGERDAVLASHLTGNIPAGGPVVGDWVGCESAGSDLRIRTVLPRQTELVRGAKAGAHAPQAIAANVDTVFIVQSFDTINERRLERYIAAVRAGGAEPVILLNKADVVSDDVRADLFMGVSKLAGAIPVFELSASDGTNVPRIGAMIMEGTTAVFAGVSGVGKSTLVNRLLDDAVQETADVRADDSRGRHTTTARELFLISSGGMIIDTPGMREFALWDDGTGVAAVFDEIVEAAEHCRFSDCTHTVEPDCGVLRAVETGEIERERYDSWLKLSRETAARKTVMEGYLKADERKKWKRFGRMVKEAKDLKKRF